MELAQHKNRIILALAGFILTVILAHVQQWTAGDLVWSMWTASLISGYSLIVYALLNLQKPDGGSVAFGRRAFLLLFFTFHFGMFHFVHQVFLAGFFPPEDIGVPYDQGPIAFVGGLAERFSPFILIVLGRMMIDIKRDNRPLNEGDLLKRPYGTVVANHLTIFAVAFSHAMIGQSTLLYVLLVIYFFPFDIFFNTKQATPRDPYDATRSV